MSVFFQNRAEVVFHMERIWPCIRIHAPARLHNIPKFRTYWHAMKAHHRNVSRRVAFEYTAHDGRIALQGRKWNLSGESLAVYIQVISLDNIIRAYLQTNTSICPNIA